MVKSGIRVLGIDDAAFEFGDEETFLTGVVYRGNEFAEDVQVEEVEVDGYDATEKVVSLFRKCGNQTQIKAIMTDGVSFAGFNLIDLEEVSERTGKPAIAVTSNEPDKEDFRDAMERTGNYDQKFEKLGEYSEIELKDGKVFIQYAGTELEEAKEIVRNSTVHGLAPEPIRLSHMIGRAFR